MIKDFIFAPLSLLYGAAMTLRNLAYDFGIMPAYKSKLRVVSVGNISAGGNGKTPTVLFLAGTALRIDRRPVVLSRGYMGRIRGPHLVRAADSYLDVGDEPLLMARRHNMTVVIARDRVEGAKFIEREDLGDLIILDDGFQHRRLARDVDLVCVNWTGTESAREFGLGRVLPWGLFRERKIPALKRATQILFVNRSPGGQPPALPDLSRPLLAASYAPTRPLNAEGDELKAGDAVAAFSTIANPEGFRLTLDNLGLKVKAFKAFADHERIDISEVEKHLGTTLPVVCTEKDWVKLPDSAAKAFFVLPIALQPKEESRFALESLVRG